MSQVLSAIPLDGGWSARQTSSSRARNSRACGLGISIAGRTVVACDVQKKNLDVSRPYGAS
jgi:hypothetical protein